MLELNAAAVAHARERIDAGAFVTGGAWEWATEDLDALLGAENDWDRLALAHLAFDPAEELESVARYRLPFCRANDAGELVVFRAGLLAAIEAGAGGGTEDAARELVSQIDKSDPDEEAVGVVAGAPAAPPPSGGKPPTIEVEQNSADRAPALYRDLSGVDRRAVDEQTRSAWLAVSSDEPVDRLFGLEELDHSPEAIRLDRFRSFGPLLVEHKWEDHIGTVEEVELRGRKLYARVRFGRSARAEEVFRDVLDGIRRGVSVGYFVHALQLVERREDAPDRYRVTDWEPFEVSLVAVPADVSVGVGRSKAGEQLLVRRVTRAAPGATTPQEVRKVSKAKDAPTNETGAQEQNHTNTEQTAAEVRGAREEGARAERDRVRQIAEYGRLNGAEEFARKHIDEGTPVDKFRALLLEKMGTGLIRADDRSDPSLGLSERERRSYSVARLIHALANPADRSAQERAAFELEASRAFADKLGREARGAWIPSDISNPAGSTRALQATAGQEGAELGGFVRGGDFIEYVYGASVLLNRARVVRNVPGAFEIPRQDTGVQGEWPSTENAALTATGTDEATFSSVKFEPKSLGSTAKISRKLLAIDNPDAEMLIREDLGEGLGHALDRGAIRGNGAGGMAGEVVGILYESGVGVVDFQAGLPGVAGVSAYYELALELERLVAEGNGEADQMLYITSPKVRALAKGSPMFSGGGLPVWMNDNTLNGYPAIATTKSPDDLDVSNYSAMAFGNIRQAMFAIFSGVDLVVDPYTSAKTNQVEVTAWMEADFHLRRPDHWARSVNVS